MNPEPAIYRDNQSRVAAFVAGSAPFVRNADSVQVLAWRNLDEDFELRLPNYYEDGVLKGEGGCMRVKKGDYLCRDAQGNCTTYSEAVFAVNHARFIPGFIPAGPLEKLVDAAFEKAAAEIVPNVPDEKL